MNPFITLIIVVFQLIYHVRVIEEQDLRAFHVPFSWQMMHAAQSSRISSLQRLVLITAYASNSVRHP